MGLEFQDQGELDDFRKEQEAIKKAVEDEDRVNESLKVMTLDLPLKDGTAFPLCYYRENFVDPATAELGVLVLMPSGLFVFVPNDSCSPVPRSINQEAVPLNISDIRKRYGLNQQEFSSALGLSDRMTGYYERGKYKPSGKTLLKIRKLEYDLWHQVIERLIDGETEDLFPETS